MFNLTHEHKHKKDHTIVIPVKSSAEAIAPQNLLCEGTC